MSRPGLAVDTRARILLILTLVVAAIIITRGIGVGEFNINVDEAFHAATGLFFADVFRDAPVTNPIAYTYAYYAQYPALGLAHWPPLFHLVEGAIFLVFGPSVVAARSTILAFALVGLYFWFKLVKELLGEWAAAASALILACLPAVLLYEKAVMLEVPSLALCIGAIYYWFRYLREGGPRLLLLFSVLAGLALLTKQQSAFLAPLCLLSVAVMGKWRLFWNPTTTCAAAIGFLMVVPYYVVSLRIDRQSVAANVLQGVDAGRPNPFSYYLEALPGELGWLLLALSIVGIATCWRGAKRQGWLLMVSWIVAWYVTYFIVSTKQVRYMVYWLPPFIYFAVAAFSSIAWSRRARVVAGAALLSLLGSSLWTGWTYQRPYVRGYRILASEVLQRADGGVVLFDGDLAANYIYFMRALDPDRRFVVLRKALYSTRVMRQFGSVELVHSQQDIEDVLDDFGIRYVMVEENSPTHFDAQRLLRELLLTSRFRLVRSIPIESNVPKWSRRSLQLYENLAVRRRSAEVLDLRMLSLDQDIVVPLSDLLKD